jgi:hypothetical protein
MLELGMAKLKTQIERHIPRNTSQQQKAIAEVGVMLNKEVGVPDKKMNMMT